MLLYKRLCLFVCLSVGRSVGYPSKHNNIVSTQFLTDIIDSTQHVGALGHTDTHTHCLSPSLPSLPSLPSINLSCRVQVVDCTPTLDLQGARMFTSAFYYIRNSIVLIGGYADWSGKLSNMLHWLWYRVPRNCWMPLDCAKGFLVETVVGIQ